MAIGNGGSSRRNSRVRRSNSRSSLEGQPHGVRTDSCGLSVVSGDPGAFQTARATVGCSWRPGPVYAAVPLV